MKVSRFDFGATKTGEIVQGIRIDNEKGIDFSVISYGATLISFQMADRENIKEECVLGFDNMPDYEKHGAFFGATIGRVGNRIGKGRYTLDGKEYNLSINDQDRNHLHGGIRGFDKVIWQIEAVTEEKGKATVKCTYISQDGEENYPGNLQVEVQYILDESGHFTIDYRAKTDKRTPVNLTNHSYWNLSGNKKERIYKHKLQIEAESYLPVDNYSIPTGEIRKVENTSFDFRKVKEIGPALKESGGFDHNFNLSEQKQSQPVNRMYVEHESSGRVMEIHTTEPGVQLYTGNFLHTMAVKGFNAHDALCLETQMFPDAVNKPDFPSTILNPGEIYKQTTIHKFSLLD
jgi:aldose 1-epimerase